MFNVNTMPVMKYFLALGLMIVCSKLSVRAATNVLPDLEPNAIGCHSDYINITISDSYLSSLNLTGDQIHKMYLVTNNTQDRSNDTDEDKECMATRISSGYNFFLNNSYGECSISKKVINYWAFIYYKVRIILFVPVRTVVVRLAVYEFSLHCKYYIKLSGRVGPLIPWVKKEKLLILPKKEEFTASIKLYTDRYYNQTIPNNGNVKVRVPYPIFVGIWLHVKEGSRLVLQARKCWVTPNPSEMDPQTFRIIDNNGCDVKDRDFNGNNTIKENFMSSHVYFSFNSFYWLSEGIPMSRLYLHCWLTVCHPLAEGNCTEKPACSSKKRRSIGMEKTGKMTTVTYGPIEVVKDPVEIDANGLSDLTVEKDTLPNPSPVEETSHGSIHIARKSPPCSKKDLGCSYDCAVGNLGNEMCVCPVGFGVHQNGKLCFQHPWVVNEAEHQRKTEYVIPTVAMLALMMVCITVLLKKTCDDY